MQQDEPCTALWVEARQSRDVSELEVLGHPQRGWGSERTLSCQKVESRSSLAGLAEAWGCEKRGAAFMGLQAGAEHGSLYTAKGGFMLLTEELWMQNDQRCNRGKAQSGMGCNSPSHRCFPEQVHTPPTGDARLGDGCI